MLLAFDRSERWKDQDGNLHVRVTNISKAIVNPYRGSEIPGSTELGLAPDRIYQLLRHPDELARGAASFNNLRLLSKHVAVSATDPKEELVAGSTGTDARFEYPYLTNSLVVWRAEDIAAIEARDKCELSCAYYYDADMTPGVYEGVPFDGVMRNLRGNHVALVEAGRAGPDVMVHDAALSEAYRMSTPLLSRTAVMAKGALTAYLAPRLKPGATLALDAALDGVTCFTWPRRRADLAQAIIRAATPKLAADAKLDDLATFLGALDAEEDGEEDDMEAMDADLSDEEREQEKEARDAEMKDGMRAEDRARAAKDRRAARDAKRASDKKAMDAKKARDKAAKDKRAKDKAARDKWRAADTDKSFEDWAKEEENEPEHEAEDSEAETTLEREARDKKAMDAAIETAVTAAEKRVIDRMKALAVAREDVRPIIGSVSLAIDTAAGVYKMALDHLGVDTKDVPPAAYAAVLRAVPKATPPRPAMAHDQAQSGVLNQMFPTLSRIRQA